MNRPIPDGGGGGTVVQINIAEFRALITGMESAHDDLEAADRSARSNLSRLSLSESGMGRLQPVRSWISDAMPGLRRRLALAEALSQTSPGLPNSVTFTEESLTLLTPEQARQKAREAAKLLNEKGSGEKVYQYGSNLNCSSQIPVCNVPGQTTVKGRIWGALWRYAAQVRAKRDARVVLAREFGSDDLSDWPAPIVKFLLGKLPAGELEVAAESDDAAKKTNGKCMAAYFIGMDSVRRGDRQRAREQFQLAQARCPTMSEYNWAASNELKRL